MPKISVIIPTYNSAQFIERAIASIYAQTVVADWEIIVVDDGSTDDTQRMITTRYPAIRYSRQSNQGPAAARNRGLASANGEWFTFLDADDCWPPDRTAILLSVFDQSPDLMVVAGLEQFVFEDPDEAGRWRFTHPDQQRFHIHLGARLFRPEAFRRIGGFDETMRYSEDIDWINRAKEAGLAMQSIEQTTLLYTVHAHGMTYHKNVHHLQLLQALKKSLDRRRAESTGTLPMLATYGPQTD